MEPTRCTVWSYRTSDEDGRPILRTIFFYVGSVIYNGCWMGCSDCMWIVPEPNPWVRQ